MVGLKAGLCFWVLTWAGLGLASRPIPLLHTTCGTLTGTYEGDVQVFRNVPYAEAPVGHLRWRPAVGRVACPPDRDYTRNGNICWQPAEYAEGLNRSEDCLNMNIYIPMRKAETSEPLNIIFWIYGGSLVVGSVVSYGSLATFAHNMGAVVVAPNYRLGALGFLATEALAVDDPRNGRGEVHVYRDGERIGVGAAALRSELGGGSGVTQRDSGSVSSLTGDVTAPATHPHQQQSDHLASGGGNFGITDLIEALKWTKANSQPLASGGGGGTATTVAGSPVSPSSAPSSSSSSSSPTASTSALRASPSHDQSRAPTVTLMGQSSGGTAILALMRAPVSFELWDNAISLSASPNMTMTTGPKWEADEHLLRQAKLCTDATAGVRVGEGEGGSGDGGAGGDGGEGTGAGVGGEQRRSRVDALAAKAACLRALPAEEILNATASLYAGDPILASDFPSGPPPTHLPWAPVVYVDGVTVADPEPGVGRGVSLAGKSILLQSVMTEDLYGNMNATVLLGGRDGSGHEWESKDTIEWIAKRFESSGAYPSNIVKRAAEVLYESVLGAAPSRELGTPGVSLYAAASTAHVQCGNAVEASAAVAAGAYVYVGYYAAAFGQPMKYTKEGGDWTKCEEWITAPPHGADWFLGSGIAQDGWSLYCPYTMTPSDVEVGRWLRKVWGSVLSGGPVKGWTLWDENVQNVNMITSDHPEGVPTNAVADVCATYTALRIGRNWWWIN